MDAFDQGCLGKLAEAYDVVLDVLAVGQVSLSGAADQPAPFSPIDSLGDLPAKFRMITQFLAHMPSGHTTLSIDKS
jgi:hypothetical protein